MTTTADQPRTTLTDAKSKLRMAAGSAEHIAEWKNPHEHIDAESLTADAAEVAELLRRLLDATGRAAVRHADTITAAHPDDRQTFETMRHFARQARELRDGLNEAG